MARPEPSPLRVLLDVTKFGYAQTIPKTHRDGINRVVEATAKSVSTMPGVSMTLCARRLASHALAYAEAHPDLRALPFRPRRREFGARLRARVVQAHARAGAHPPGSLPLRIANTMLSHANRALDVPTGGVGWSTLMGADVFHSPIFALPKASERRVARVRYFLTVHDLIPFLIPQSSAEAGATWLEGLLGTLGPEDHVLTVSEHTRTDLLNVRPDIDPARVHVTLLAADTERFYRCDDPGQLAATRARYGIPDAPYVLSVGTLQPRKNIPHLVKSFAALVRAERLDDLHLVLTGSQGGGDFDAIVNHATKYSDLRDRIVFTGFVDDTDLAALFSGALVFAYPSLYEGFGLPPLEAMQCGTPVITSDRSSLPEVVGDGGVLVDPLDQDALAQAILDVYRDSGHRADLAVRATARARQFTWERFAEQTVGAYRATR
jgi:glycosyltransferase involved in cell wall biosynthesis